MSRSLYHYTNAHGLIGIVESGRIWATDTRFLNDSLEVRYAADRVVEALRMRADQEDRSAGPRWKVLTTASQMLAEPELFVRAYVACFYEQGDLLSQWRAYGSDQGYAIEFDAGMLARTEQGDAGDQPPILTRVVYGLEEAGGMLTETLDNAGHTMSAHTGTAAHYTLMWQIVPMLAQIKHPAFREEHEWRLILVRESGYPQTRFRTSRIGVVPYLPVPFPPGAIVRIIVGPGEHTQARRAGVLELLRANAFSDLNERILLSESPLRV